MCQFRDTVYLDNVSKQNRDRICQLFISIGFVKVFSTYCSVKYNKICDLEVKKWSNIKHLFKVLIITYTETADCISPVPTAGGVQKADHSVCYRRVEMD